VRVIYEQLVKGESMSLEECMRMDFVLTQKFMKGEEFFEGVRCALVDKQDSP
jgi:enoyl-CoA hydratase